MLHNQLSKKLVIASGLVVAMGAFGATLSFAEQARSRTSVSSGTKSSSSSGRTAVQRGGGSRGGSGAGVTRSGGGVDRSRSRGGRHYRGHRHYGGLRLGLGYYGGWGGFYGGYGGYYYSPFYYGYPVFYSHHPRRFSDFGALDINVRPKKTEVWVDGQYVGRAGRFDGYPGHLWLGDGRHELIFFKQGFETVRREVRVLEGVVLDIDHRMVPGESIPADELTTFSQEAVAPKAPERAAPARSNAVERPAMGDRKRVERRAVREDARAEPGRLKLDVFPADASIYLDGRFLGSGVELARLHSGLMVSPGEHTVEVVRPGFGSQEVVFSALSGEETSMRIDLEETALGASVED